MFYLTLLTPGCVFNTQESAEEEQASARAGVRTDQHKTVQLLSHSTESAVQGVQASAVTAGSSDVKLASAAPSSALYVSLCLADFVLQPDSSLEN